MNLIITKGFVATVVLVILGGVLQVSSQSPGTNLRRVQVNAQVIKALARGKKYVVDLTRPGVKYEFDSRQVDFSRVLVQTAQGRVAISSFLEKTFLKGKLAGFKWTSQSFSIRTRSAGTLQTRPTVASPPNEPSKLISCGSETCTCVGDDSCDEMIDLLPLCGEIFFCKIDPISRQQVCTCERRSPP